MSKSAKGLLLVISGPGGVGKGTVCKELLREGDPDLVLSVSVTTRRPRPDEKEGEHYFFRSREEFVRMRDAGLLLEAAEIDGNLYGTPREKVETLLAAGKTIVLEIDVRGGRQVKALLPGLSVFLMPPSMEELEARFRKRGTDSESVLARRMKLAAKEMEAAAEYDFVVVNDELARAVAEIRHIIQIARKNKEEEF
jgi:guanylate kinase